MHTINVLADGLKFPEGPAFDAAGRLWFCELDAGAIGVWQPDTAIRRFATGGIPNGLTIGRDGRVYVADKNAGLLRFDPDAEKFETLATHVQGQKLAEPNDLCFDPAGNLVFTCPGGSAKTGTGYVCRCNRDGGEVSRIATGLFYPNGLAFTADRRRLLVAETMCRRLLMGAYDPAGPLELAPWSDVGGGTAGPDGLAVDSRGHVCAAIYGWGQIALVDLHGQVIDRIGVPGANPTNCAFDPIGRLGLIVTEAEQGRLLSIGPASPALPLLD